jgi:hypothetical protein
MSVRGNNSLTLLFCVIGKLENAYNWNQDFCFVLHERTEVVFKLERWSWTA